MPAAMSSSKSITVSIVSHGQQALVLPLLEQLDRLCAQSVAKVVLTMNLPEHDLLVDRAFCIPIERIANERPRGFGANHNAAFERCHTDWFLVLNPDIRLDMDVLAALLALAHADSGMLAPRIMEPGKALPEPHRAMLTPSEILQRNRPGYLAPSRPAWVPGMFMLFRALAFTQIRGFDARYFMYGEDFDICARLQLAGWQMHVVEHLRVRHEAQRASRRQLRHLSWHFRSLIKVWCSSAFWRYRQLRARA